jgi:hypothetical protein
MFRVRVNKIESTRDLDGNLGKRIELVEEREVANFVMRPSSEAANANVSPKTAACATKNIPIPH